MTKKLHFNCLLSFMSIKNPVFKSGLKPVRKLPVTWGWLVFFQAVHDLASLELAEKVTIDEIQKGHEFKPGLRPVRKVTSDLRCYGIIIDYIPW